jgi:nitrite reductase/ring-hydroxylating ferredoxin subunit
MQRRAFLKKSCKLCVLGAVGATLPQVFLSCGNLHSLSITLPIENNKISLPLSLFETAALQLIRPKGGYYNIAVFKTENGFDAILMKCTHMDNQLHPSSEGFHCNMHGSEFSKTGIVKKGPAERNLIHYKTVLNQEQLLVLLP